mmetsp:Transcript_9110/g.15365  ORF Transcript_9110/g.15365 Transcript_9110/m.15365 type:complete len:99 (-) Transcript_9110:20-316(-)
MLSSGFLPPTDTRFRKDIRLFEMGKDEEADHEKGVIEQKQRERREQTRARGLLFTPSFFDQQAHPHIPSQTLFKLKEGAQGYWERRQRKDWRSTEALF